MRKLILLAALAIASCKPQAAADGYDFERGSQRIYSQGISVVIEPSVAALQHDFAQQPQAPMLGADEKLFAFTRLTPQGVCTIYIVDPAVKYIPEDYGHELIHCVYGNFHASQDKERRG